jgi:hypothetical protein
LDAEKKSMTLASSSMRRATTTGAVALSIAAVLTGCFGGKEKAAPTTASGSTANGAPTPSPTVDPCVLTVDEVKKAIGTAPSGPGQGTAFQCVYQIPGKDGTVSSFEIRVKGWVSDPGVIETERQIRGNRTPVEVEAGRGALVFEADPLYKDVPGFVMTNAGYATITWLPGGEPTEKDTKAVVAITKAVGKKLEAPIPIQLPGNNPPEGAPAATVQPQGAPAPVADAPPIAQPAAQP